MSTASKFLRGGLALAVFASLAGTIAAPAAHADPYDRYERERHRDWREHEHRREEWRARRYDNRYYYGQRYYTSPPVVYGPPPPPPGLNLLFNVR